MAGWVCAYQVTGKRERSQARERGATENETRLRYVPTTPASVVVLLLM